MIRKAISAYDIEEIAEIAKETWTATYVSIIGQEQVDYMLEKYQSTEAINKSIVSGDLIYYILEESDEVRGYFALGFQEDAIFISKIYVSPRFQHQGAGKKMFNFIVDFAKEHGKPYLRLTVNKNNVNAIAAYNKYGFETEDSTVVDIGSGFVMDDYIMISEL